jgi:hypothetical protein
MILRLFFSIGKVTINRADILRKACLVTVIRRHVELPGINRDRSPQACPSGDCESPAGSLDTSSAAVNQGMPVMKRTLLPSVGWRNPIGRCLMPTLAAIALACTAPLGHADLHVQILKSFSFLDQNGQLADFAPIHGVIEGSDGVLYGTTSRDSADTAGPGAVFRINKDGTDYRVLHEFEHEAGSRSGPIPSKLIEGTDGMLYGLALCDNCSPYVFRVDRDGSNFTVLLLFSFDTLLAGGFLNSTGLVEGKDGNLYGTASGGPYSKPDVPFVFTLKRDGSGFNVVQAVEGLANGASAYGLIAGRDGVLYGATTAGSGTFGTIFRVDADGTGYRELHNFGASTNGGTWEAIGPFIEGSDGVLYGSVTGDSSPTSYPPVTLFKLNTDGTGYQTLLQPDPLQGCGQAIFPTFSLFMEGRDGLLYGVMSFYGCMQPKIFSIRKDGTGYAELFSGFGNFGDTVGSVSGLIQSSDGAFYGTDSWSGPQGAGFVFKLWPLGTPDLLISAPKPDGSVALSFLSTPPTNAVLLAATNLAPPVIWQPVVSGNPGNGIWQFMVTNAPNAPVRIFQVVTGWSPWVPASIPTASSWLSVASCADGTKLIAAGYPGYPWNYDPSTDPFSPAWAQTRIGVTSTKGWLYTSVDSGATWTQSSAPSNFWTCVASSADGSRLAAVAADSQQGKPGSQYNHQYGDLLVSADSGATWTKTAAPNLSWAVVSLSANAAELGVGGGFLYTSSDFGGSWTRSLGPLPGQAFSSIACSTDGSQIVATLQGNPGGAIYLSRNAGATWTQTSAPAKPWSTVAASADGTKLVAGVWSGGDFGELYQKWSSVACSADGKKLLAVSVDGAIYALQLPAWLSQ